MSKIIILSEKQERDLFENIINEEIAYLGDKEDLVLKWLNKHFKTVDMETTDNLTLPTTKKVVSVLDAYGQISNNIKTLEDVFFIMQTKFKKILSDKKDRDDFLRSVLKKWSK